MGALPRPDLPPGPQRTLNDTMHELHHRAGWPSLRILAREAGCSHTTVSKAFSTAALPAWGVLELLVEALHGDVEHLHALWLAASTPAAAETRNDVTRQSRIAGRKGELSTVSRHLVSGVGLLLVTGEAGIGKTKLVSMAGVAATDTFVATGSCLPLSGEVPLLPLADALRRIHAIDGGQWIKEAVADCAAFVPAALRVLLPELDLTGPPSEPEDQWSRQRLFLATGSTLETLSTLRPLAVVIEDLHWADSATLDFLEHLLVTRADAVPMVGTWRVEDPSTRTSSAEWLARVRRLPVVHEMELTPLSRDETADQLRMLASSTPDPAWVDHIFGRTQGQPLFTEQLAAEATPGDSTPRLLTDLLDQRLEGLGETHWRVARALGVADRALSDGQLKDATGLAADELGQCLRELRRHRLLAATPSPHDVQLRHPLLAEAIRRRLVAGEEATEHRRIADALASSAAASAAEIATHWRAAGDAPLELVWRIRAARAASDLFDAKRSAQEWLRVLELWSEAGSSGEPDLTLSAVYTAVFEQLIQADDRERGRALASEAMSSVSKPDGSEGAELYRRIAICLAPTDIRAALSMVSRAVRIYESGVPSKGLLSALEAQSHYLRACGEYAEAETSIARAVEVSKALDDPSWQRRTLMQLAWYDLVAGEPARAVGRAEDAVAIRPVGFDPITELMTGTEHTDILLIACAPADEVVRAARPGLELADLGMGGHLISILRSNVTQALIDSGDLAGAAALLDPVTSGEVTQTGWADHLERAHLDVARGHVESATARLAALDALMRSYDDGECLRWIANRAAQADLWSDRPQAALDRTAQALAGDDATNLAFWGSLFVLAARAAADLAQRSGTAGRREELQQQLAELKAVATIDPFGPSSPCGDRTASGCTWIAERTRIQGTQTVEHWAAAAAEWDRLRHPYDAAYCRWRAAQVALAEGNATVAKRLLGRAGRQARGHAPLSSAIEKTAEARSV